MPVLLDFCLQWSHVQSNLGWCLTYTGFCHSFRTKTPSLGRSRLAGRTMDALGGCYR